MSEKHYPYYGGSFDRIIFDKDGSVWVHEEESVKLREENAKLREEIEAAKHDLQVFSRRSVQLDAENAKLVSVLHEVEEDAVYAYHSLQHDIEAMVSNSSHYFLKWWHAECESDRLKRDNAKLLKIVSCLLTCANDTGDCDRCPLNGGTGDWNSEDFCDDLLDCLRELGIEVDG